MKHLKRILKRPITLVLAAMALVAVLAHEAGLSWEDSIVTTLVLYVLLFFLAFVVYFAMALYVTIREERGDYE